MLKNIANIFSSYSVYKIISVCVTVTTRYSLVLAAAGTVNKSFYFWPVLNILD